jgi:hypothetical protein
MARSSLLNLQSHYCGSKSRCSIPQTSLLQLWRTVNDTQDQGGQQGMKSLKQGKKCEASPAGFLIATIQKE